MSSYLFRRLIEILPTVVGISLLTFLIVRLLPGDPASYMAGDNLSAADVANVRAQLGLDRPIWMQLLDYLAGVVRLDFGTSFLTHMQVRDLLMRALPFTVVVASASMALGTVIAIPLGALAAYLGWRGHRALDQGLTWSAMVVDQMPAFWLGPIFILIFVLGLGWFPATGDVPWDNPRLLFLRLAPAIFILAAGQVASIARITRTAVREVLDEDYIRTARALGQSGLSILFRQAVRNGLLPVVTAMGLSFGRLLGGTVIVEAIFALPGLGTLLINAVNGRDYPIVQGVVFVYALMFVLTNLATDIVYRFIDPRVKF